MSLGIKIEGGGAFLKLQIAGRKLDEQVRKELRALAAEGRAQVVAAIRAPKSGRKYGGVAARGYLRRQRVEVTTFGGGKAKVSRPTLRTKKTRPYTASAPGQAPAIHTGTLLRSIRTKLPAREKGYGVKVFADRGTAFYRHMLEFGRGTLAKKGAYRGRNIGVILPRPLWSPIQQRMEAQLEGRILRAVTTFEADI